MYLPTFLSDLPCPYTASEEDPTEFGPGGTGGQYCGPNNNFNEEKCECDDPGMCYISLQNMTKLMLGYIARATLYTVPLELLDT